jgi:catechol 1,2-dioxygenase
MAAPASTTDYAQQAISAMGPNTNPRLRTIMTSLIQHLHAFARETSLTTDEWLAGVELINAAGRKNEGRLLCDILGLER